MQIEKDYILRLIYEIIRTLLHVLFQIDIARQNGPAFEDEQRMEWFRQLTAMIDEGELNEAETELLEGINANSMKDYELALWFYAYLNEKDNAFLETHNFSRKEVLEGIRLTGQIFGYRSIVDPLLEGINAEML